MKKHQFNTPTAAIPGQASLTPNLVTLFLDPRGPGANDASRIYVQWFDDQKRPQFETSRSGGMARTKILQLNTVNCNPATGGKSLQQHIIEEFAVELAAYAPGTIAGVDDAP